MYRDIEGTKVILHSLNEDLFKQTQKVTFAIITPSVERWFETWFENFESKKGKDTDQTSLQTSYHLDLLCDFIINAYPLPPFSKKVGKGQAYIAS